MKQRKRGKSDLVETIVIAIILLIMILIALRMPGKSSETFFTQYVGATTFSTISRARVSRDTVTPKDFPSYQFIVSKLRSNRGNRILKPIRPVGLGVEVMYGAPLVPGGVITCRPTIKTTPTRPFISYMELVCRDNETNLRLHEIIWERGH